MSESGMDDSALRNAQDAWLRYLELLDPFRPDLFRYCRRLTGNAWDADLIQDTIEQGFARIVMSERAIANPRGYVLRIASNLWVSRRRRAGLERASTGEANAERLQPQALTPPDGVSALRDAGAALLQQLAPQERAAVLLKEIFDLSLEEIAEALDTSVGAVKAALHRGRERLREGDSVPARYPASREVVERFVELYNRRDMPGMLAMMLDHAPIEMPVAGQYIGRKVWGRERGWFYHNFYSPFDGAPTKATWQTAFVADELVVLVFDAQQRVTSVMRLQTEGDEIARIRVYGMCPDTVREVAQQLGLTYGGFAMYHLPRAVLARIVAAAAERERA